MRTQNKGLEAWVGPSFLKLLLMLSKVRIDLVGDIGGKNGDNVEFDIDAAFFVYLNNM